MKIEVEILSREKNRLELLIKGETHTLLNILTRRLNEREDIVAGYRMIHPLKEEAILLIKTNGKDPVEALIEAIEQTKKEFTDLEEKFLNVQKCT